MGGKGSTSPHCDFLAPGRGSLAGQQHSALCPCGTVTTLGSRPRGGGRRPEAIAGDKMGRAAWRGWRRIRCGDTMAFLFPGSASGDSALLPSPRRPGWVAPTWTPLLGDVSILTACSRVCGHGDRWRELAPAGMPRDAAGPSPVVGPWRHWGRFVPPRSVLWRSEGTRGTRVGSVPTQACLSPTCCPRSRWQRGRCGPASPQLLPSG